MTWEAIGTDLFGVTFGAVVLYLLVAYVIDQIRQAFGL